MDGRWSRWLVGAGVASVLAAGAGRPSAMEGVASPVADAVVLPRPDLEGGMSVERALAERRSVRTLADAPIPRASLSRLVWAAQGVTDDKGHRTTPSGRATYPLDVYAVVGNVTDVAPGIYRYDPVGHALLPRQAGDRRQAFVTEAVGQSWIEKAAVILVVTGTPERARAKMGDRVAVYTPLEAGLASQNVLLEVVSLGLGATFVGGFDPAKAAAFLQLAPGENAYAVLPVGVRQ